MTPEPLLLVAGTRYGGWTRIRVTVSIERAAGAFDIEVTERWPGGAAVPLRPGLACTLSLAGQDVLTGWIDRVSRDLGPTMRTVRISGRDRTGDLVDCCAEVKQYSGQGLLAIAQDQCRAYGVSVTSNMDLGDSFKRVAVEPGERAFEFLEKLARQRGALLMADGKGGLLIGKPGGATAASALIEGQNLLGIRAEAEWLDRYSDYIVRGQSAGDDDWNGRQAAEEESSVQDSEVAASRYRPLIVMAEDGETDLSRRAQWERRVRYGRSVTASCLVQGWEAAPGRLWKAGERVSVEAPSMSLREELLIVQAAYGLDEQGTLTELSLTRPGAFEVLAEAPKGGTAEGGEWWT